MVSEHKKKELKALGFDEEVDRLNRGECPFCGAPTDDNSFRDELSVREFRISGLCQKCQDKTFGKH
jgi:hypothetical protein